MDILKKLRVRPSNNVPPDEITAHYHELSPYGTKEIAALVRQVTVWRLMNWTTDQMKRSIYWYSAALPANHPEHLFTDRGKTTSLLQVAERWKELHQQLPDHPLLHNIEYFRERLWKRQPLPALIGVTGRIDKRIYIIDGNTRALAAATMIVEDPHFVPDLQIYLGRKPYIDLESKSLSP